MKVAPFDKSKAPVVWRGVVWQFNEKLQQWQRAICRLYKDKTQYWSITKRVNGDRDFCMHCLSNNVQQTGTRQEPGQPSVATFACPDCRLNIAIEL